MATKTKAKYGQIQIVSSNLEKRTSTHGQSDVEIDAMWVVKNWPNLAIWGAQEAAQWIDILKGMPDVKVATVRGAKGYELNNPIMYDPDQMKLLGSKLIHAHPGQAHAFPGRIIQCSKFKWIAGDGSICYYNNTHLNSHIEKAGHPRPLPRVKLSTKHIHLLGQEMKGDSQGRRLAFGGGDMNIDEDADNRVHWSGFPEAIFRKYGIESIYDELGTPRSFDTHTSRKIDVIYSCQADTRVSAVRVIKSTNRRSDHYFIKGTYKVRLMG